MIIYIMNVVQTVLIAIVFLIIIYYVIQWFTTKSVKLSTMQKGTSTTTISASKLKNNNVGNFTYSIWYYIDDWNSNYGKKKTLMRVSNKDGGAGPSMHINLGETENNINITVRCYNEKGGGGGSCPTECETCGYIDLEQNHSGQSTCPGTCYTNSMWPEANTPAWKLITKSRQATAATYKNKYGENIPGSITSIETGAGGIGPYCYGGRVQGAMEILTKATDTSAGKASLTNIFGASAEQKFMSDSASGNTAGEIKDLAGITLGSQVYDCTSCSSSGSSKMSTCTVSNFPLQKWVNLTVSVYGRTLDVYLDGKLTHTCVLPGPANMNNLNNIVITPQGAGFDGYTSDLTYYPTASNPQEAYNIYKSGFGGSSMSNILNKYRVQISFLENNEEQWHVDI